MGLQNIYTKNLPGMIDYAGNTLGLNGACTSFSNINTGCNSPGTSGIAGAWITTDTTKYANTNWQNFVNNLPYATTNGGTTFDYIENSSSDEINIPSGVTIDYAVLIWSGNNLSGTANISTEAINLIDSTDVVHSITPQYYSINTSAYGYYTCATEVTNIVTNAGSGFYTVGSVYSEFNNNIACAGWLLVVVYTSPYLQFINVNINIGNLDISGDGPSSTVLSGFSVIDTGPSLRAGIIITALNGDPASGGDQVSLTNISGSPTYLYGPYNPVDNFFGSQIIDIEGNICTDGTFGNLNTTPNTVQTTLGRRIGYDISIVDASPALSNAQTSTTLTGVTTGNNYSITSAILIVRDKSPSLNISAISSKSIVLLGQQYTVTYTIENIGDMTTDSMYLTYDDGGLTFESGLYTISGVTTPIISSPNSLLIPNLDVGDTISISLTYTANQIPNILYYDNLATIYYTFIIDDQGTFNNTVQKGIGVDIAYIDTIQVTNVDSENIVLPLVNPTDPNISGLVINQPTKGSVILTQTNITYTPNTLQQTTDQFIVQLINTSNDKFVNLIYNVNQVVDPMINMIINQGPTVELYSTVTSTITLQNLSNFIMSDVHTWPSLAPGFVIPEAKITNSLGAQVDMIRIANNFTIGDILGNSSATWTFTYKAVMLPTDLLYSVGETIGFTFGGVYFDDTTGSNLEPSNTITPIANIDITVNKNEVYSELIPIIENDYPYLSYSVKTQGSFGSATVSPIGLLTYTPNSNFIGTDNLTITINNSQPGVNTTLDINYLFDIIEPINIPCPDDIPSKLVKLLNYDVYLMALQKGSISEDVCFDCTLWNNGYTDSAGDVIIPPISASLVTILTQIANELQSILNDNNLNGECNQYGFKTQVDRLLFIINDLKNKVLSINCNNNSCNSSMLSSLLTLLSNTLDTLIVVMSTLNGLLGICSNNCLTCNLSFSNLMGIFINSITQLSNLLNSWNTIVITFISLNTFIDRPYVAGYVPNRPINVPRPNNIYANGFACIPQCRR